MTHTLTIILTTLLLLMPSLSARAAATVSAPAGALVSIPVANIRTAPGHSSELSTQALLGTPLEILSEEGEWLKVRLPDGYTGYIITTSITMTDRAQMAAWRGSPRLVAVNPAVTPVLADTLGSHQRKVTWLPHGAIVEGIINQSGDFTAVRLPDRTEAYCATADLMPLEELASSPPDAQTVVQTAAAAIGSPYLWGGVTLLAPDCSGLVKAAFFAGGLIVPRDASQQALAGIDIPVDHPELWMSGDLLFFAGSTPDKINHVAIYDRDSRFIHSSGRVYWSSISPDSPIYLPRPVVRVMRYIGAEGSPGISTLDHHPSYFNE